MNVTETVEIKPISICNRIQKLYEEIEGSLDEKSESLLDEITSKYREINSKYFSNQLKEYPIKLTKKKHINGLIWYEGKKILYLEFSTLIKRTDLQWYSVIAHEMIHAYQLENNKLPDHGPGFIREMVRINAIAPFEVSIKSQWDNFQTNQIEEKRLVLLFTHKSLNKTEKYSAVIYEDKLDLNEVIAHFRKFSYPYDIEKVDFIYFNAPQLSTYVVKKKLTKSFNLYAMSNDFAEQILNKGKIKSTLYTNEYGKLNVV